MRTYRTQNRFSSILSYEYGAEWIRIEFVNGMIRTYTYEDAGRKNIEAMKKYADKGAGLGSFIAKNKSKFRREKQEKTR